MDLSAEGAGIIRQLGNCRWCDTGWRDFHD